MRYAFLIMALVGCHAPQGAPVADLFPDAVDDAAARWEGMEALSARCAGHLERAHVRVADLATVRGECDTRIGWACADHRTDWDGSTFYQLWVCSGEGCDEEYLVRHEAGHVLTHCHGGGWDYDHGGPYW